MKRLLLLLLVLIARADAGRDMLIVVGEPGNPDYKTEFFRQAKAWQEIAKKSDFKVTTVGLAGLIEDGDRPALDQAVGALARDGGDLWLVWIGHGTFDGRTANFNLRGPDIDAGSLRAMLEPFTRRLVVLDFFSASGAFVAPLSKANRVIIAATRSGGEANLTRFGGRFADALDSKEADLDLDGSLSLLEAAIHAETGTKAFYDDAQRVVQEHAVIDDNGDGRGTPLSRFKGLRAESTGNKGEPDGGVAREIHFKPTQADRLTADALARRAALESSIEELKKRKATMKEDDFYRELEKQMLEMARVYGLGGKRK